MEKMLDPQSRSSSLTNDWEDTTQQTILRVTLQRFQWHLQYNTTKHNWIHKRQNHNRPFLKSCCIAQWLPQCVTVGPTVGSTGRNDDPQKIGLDSVNCLQCCNVCIYIQCISLLLNLSTEYSWIWTFWDSKWRVNNELLRSYNRRYTELWRSWTGSWFIHWYTEQSSSLDSSELL